MGAQTAVEPATLRWLTPLPLWTGILAGPARLGVRSDGELRRRQVGVPHAATTPILPLITLASLAMVVGGAGDVVDRADAHGADDVPTDGGRAAAARAFHGRPRPRVVRTVRAADSRGRDPALGARCLPVASCCSLIVYAVGVVRLWRSAGYGRGVRPFEALAFGSGWLALAIALSPPLDEWSERWLAAHMVQHELLMVVAAPLIAVGAPLVAMLWALPCACSGTRSSDGPADADARCLADDRPRRPSAFLLYGLALWIWHMPALYDAALEHEAVHVVQHLCFFGTAALFWWGIVHGRQGRLGYGAAVVYLFVTAVHGGVLGALLTVSPRVWYAPYLAHHPAGLTPLEDQQLAGLLMWIPAGLAFVAGALFLFAGVAATVRPACHVFNRRPLVRPTGIR